MDIYQKPSLQRTLAVIVKNVDSLFKKALSFYGVQMENPKDVTMFRNQREKDPL
jgi:hypothetical protein